MMATLLQPTPQSLYGGDPGFGGIVRLGKACTIMASEGNPIKAGRDLRRPPVNFTPRI